MKQGEGGFPCQGKAPVGSIIRGERRHFTQPLRHTGDGFGFSKFGTARKINMEPKNHPFRLENGLEKNLSLFWSILIFGEIL